MWQLLPPPCTLECELSALAVHTAYKTHEFFPQKDVLYEFYKVKLGRRAQALRHKCEKNTLISTGSMTVIAFSSYAPVKMVVEPVETTIDGLPALDKYAKTAVDGLPAVNKYLKTAVNGLPAFNKYAKTAVDGLPALDKHPKTVVDGLPALDKHPKTAIDALPAFNKCPKTTVDALPAFNKYAKTAVDGLPAVNKHEFGGQKDVLCEFCKAKLGKQGFALRLEPVETTKNKKGKEGE